MSIDFSGFLEVGGQNLAVKMGGVVRIYPHPRAELHVEIYELRQADAFIGTIC